MPERHASLPRPRTLVHPGPFRASRIEHMQDSRGRHFRLSLCGSPTLFDAIVQSLGGLGVGSASMTLIGGSFEQLTYCCAQPDASGHALVTYTQPIVTRHAQFIFGNATLGKTPAGKAIVHCHAVFKTADGDVLGGHLITDQCAVGSAGTTVLATALDGFDLRIDFDEETRTPLLRPQLEAGHV